MSDEVEWQTYCRMADSIEQNEIAKIPQWCGDKEKKLEVYRAITYTGAPEEVARQFFALPFLPELLLQYLKHALRRTVLKVLEPDESYNAWGWSFLVEAAVNGFLQSDDIRFVDLAAEAIDHALKNRDSERRLRDDVRGRLVQGWGVDRQPPGRWTNVVTTAGRIVSPMLDYVRICRSRDLPVNDEILPACVAATEEFLPEFVVSADRQEGLFSRPTRGDWEPLNHAVSMGRALLRLGQITGDDRYSQVAHQLATFFKRSLYLEDGRRYVWGYRPILSDRKAGFPSTFWKADVDLGFAIDCYKAGVVFDDRDLKRFGLTLKEAVFRPGWVNCSISQYKRVVALDEKFDRVGVRGYGICGWMVLSEFDESIEAYINEVLYAHRHIMPRGWLGSPRAAFGFSLKQGQGVELTR